MKLVYNPGNSPIKVTGVLVVPFRVKNAVYTTHKNAVLEPLKGVQCDKVFKDLGTLQNMWRSPRDFYMGFPAGGIQPVYFRRLSCNEVIHWQRREITESSLGREWNEMITLFKHGKLTVNDMLDIAAKLEIIDAIPRQTSRQGIGQTSPVPIQSIKKTVAVVFLFVTP